jgi:hypothetical protein
MKGSEQSRQACSLSGEADIPVTMTQREVDLMAHLTRHHLVAMQHLGNTGDETSRESTAIPQLLAELNSKLQSISSSQPDYELPVSLNAAELADTQQILQNGMTLMERVLADDAYATELLGGTSGNRDTWRDQMLAFRGVLSKLTLATLSGSGLLEIPTRLRHKKPAH